MSEIALRASRTGSRSRKPKQYAMGRVCTRGDCDTRLSRYNNLEYCFRHAPIKYPRLRGVFTEEYDRDRD